MKMEGKLWLFAERSDFELPLMLRLLLSYPWLPWIPIFLLKRCYHGYSFTTAYCVYYFVWSKRVKECNFRKRYLTLLRLWWGTNISSSVSSWNKVWRWRRIGMTVQAECFSECPCQSTSLNNVTSQ